MIFSLDVQRARQGDCLLLHFGSADRPGLALIDGGPPTVYPALKRRLMQIRKRRQIAMNEPLTIDVLMVSHVDDDHIHGILDLTRELREKPTARWLHVLSFWHNSFDDIIGNKPAELTAAMHSRFDSDEDDETARSSLKVLASMEQGDRLRGDADALGWRKNVSFGGKLIMAANKDVPAARGLTFRVAGPMQDEVKALQTKHDEWLANRKEKTAAESLAAYVDRSVTNLSSIVVVAESGGKKMLLTGDARGDRILEGLEFAGAVKRGGAMHVGVLKAPHHGSSNNMDIGFFRRITADHYVFSGNGEYGNPERDTIEMLFEARRDEPFEIHLTYPIDVIDVARKEEWVAQQAAERKRQANGSRKPVRENWSAKKHSLAAFFEARRLSAGQKIRVSEEGKAHVIDLLDPLGY